jgi:hypothetical protein
MLFSSEIKFVYQDDSKYSPFTLYHLQLKRI